MSLSRSIKAYAIILISCIIGQVSLLALGAFLFYGSFELIHTGLGTTGKLATDTILALIFPLQHSVMIRRKFRDRLVRFVRAEYHGILFTIASGIVMIAILAFWQKSAHTVFSFEEIFRWLPRATYFLSIAGLSWGAMSIVPFDPFGFYTIIHDLRGTTPPPEQLTIRGPYRYVRHPLYLFSIVMIWSCPDITADRLVFNMLWTVWIIIGARLEERDLVATFGDAYRDYQRRVPMLIPRSIHPIG